jgi:transposase InsO family protein
MGHYFFEVDHCWFFFRLYMMIDIYSRKTVGWEDHETESAKFAAALINRACLAEGACCPTGLVLHSDNGGPMKRATMLAKLQWLGVVPSFSRPSVSDYNPYSESLFKKLKYKLQPTHQIRLKTYRQHANECIPSSDGITKKIVTVV